MNVLFFYQLTHNYVLNQNNLNKVEFKIEYDNTEVRKVKSLVKGPKSSPSVGTENIRQGLLKCHFIPGEAGPFDVINRVLFLNQTTQIF